MENKGMYLCRKCGALMCGENCTNNQCDNHYITAFRLVGITQEDIAKTEGEKDDCIK